MKTMAIGTFVRHGRTLPRPRPRGSSGAGRRRHLPPARELQTGPATIPAHWSRYKYPESIPEGATYYIIKRGDTLWDLSGKFLGNPFLWPQIWDQNRYITDAHWIYPGDPLILPKVSLVTEGAGDGGEGAGEADGLVP